MNFLRNNIKVEFEKEEISAMEKTLGIFRNIYLEMPEDSEFLGYERKEYRDLIEQLKGIVITIAERAYSNGPMEIIVD